MSDVWGTVYQLERDRATGNDPDSLRREIDVRAGLEQIVAEADGDDGLTAWDSGDMARTLLDRLNTELT